MTREKGNEEEGVRKDEKHSLTDDERRNSRKKNRFSISFFISWQRVFHDHLSTHLTRNHHHSLHHRFSTDPIHSLKVPWSGFAQSRDPCPRTILLPASL
jgi:hypothetical protein